MTQLKMNEALNDDDAALISDIADRAVDNLEGFDKITVSIDLTVCHVNGNPLRLADLLDADAFNFAHDVCGINRHLDHVTGGMRDFFLPRYSV